jgi:aconitate hydratase
VRSVVTAEMFATRYSDVFKGDEQWQAIKVEGGATYGWPSSSTYVQNPPYFEGMTMTPEPLTDVVDAHVLALFGDSITTDHISPAGDIQVSGPAGKFLRDRQVPVADFNSYGARRGNHEVMMRGTFANIRIKNHMVPGIEGGVTKHYPDGAQMPIYDAAMKYIAEGSPLVVFAGKEYGTGSSRDWAAKGTRLLGVRAVIAESFERIHRSNLIGMGVIPLQFADGVTWRSLSLTGAERVSLRGVANLLPRQMVTIDVAYPDGAKRSFEAKVRIDTENELDYYRHGGILHYVLRSLASGATAS